MAASVPLILSIYYQAFHTENIAPLVESYDGQAVYKQIICLYDQGDL